MTDLISRQAAIEAIGEVHPLDYNAQAILTRLKELPTIDPVKHGKWRMKMMENVINGETRKVRECSECGSAYFVYDSSDNTIDVAPNYCPNCGAKMDGGEE